MDYQIPIVLITGVVPGRLPIGKVEIVNITCDVLAGEEQIIEVSPCSSSKLLRKKKKRKNGRDRGEGIGEKGKKEREDGGRGGDRKG